jgi:DNA polymerase-3 subunit delta
MIHFIYGHDTFSSRVRLDTLRADFISQGAEVVQLNGHGLTAEQLDRQIFSASLLNPNRLVILTSGLGEAGLKDYLVDLLSRPMPSGVTVVFYEPGSPDKRLSLFKLVTKLAPPEIFEPLTGRELQLAASGLANKHQLTLEPLLLQRIIALVGNDLWRMDQEFSKLAAFANTTPLTSVAIDQLVPGNLTDDIFGILEAISRHQPAQAQSLLVDLTQRGEDPIGILAVLAWQLRNLIRISDLSRQGNSASTIAKITGLHPYAVSSSIAQLSRLSGRWLTTAYQLVVKLDWRIKQGDIAGGDAADWLIATLSV